MPFTIQQLLNTSNSPLSFPLGIQTLSSHRIIEYQVGRDLKNHLVQTFLTKAQSRQDSPEPCPDES